MNASSDNDDAEWAVHIGQYLTPDISVLVPPRIAAWLSEKAGVSSEKRIMLRGADPEAYSVLAALHLAALHHRSGVGTKLDVGQNDSTESRTWFTTIEAARKLRVTDRAIRKMIAAGRLPARKHGGRWLLNSIHIQIAQALA